MADRSILISSNSEDLSSKVKELLSVEAVEASSSHQTAFPNVEIQIVDSVAATTAAVTRASFLVSIVSGELKEPNTAELLKATRPMSWPTIVLHPEAASRDDVQDFAGKGAQDVICIDGLTGDKLWRVIDVVATRWETTVLSQKNDYGRRLKAISELTDGLAHRINNPACYILANLSFLDEELERISGVVSKLSTTIGTLHAERPKLAAALKKELELNNGAVLAETLVEAREAIADSVQGTERICGVASELRKLLDEEQAALVRSPELNTRENMRVRHLGLSAKARVLVIENETSSSPALGHLGEHEVVVVATIGRAFETLANDRFFDAILCNGSSTDIDAAAFYTRLATRDGDIVSRTILIGDAGLRRQIENPRVPVLAEPLNAELLIAHVKAAAALSGFAETPS